MRRSLFREYNQLFEARGKLEERLPAKGQLTMELGLRISSLLNASRRGGLRWSLTRISQEHHQAVSGAWSRLRWPRDVKPALVRLVRLGKRELDYDGLVTGFKYVRDAVAAECGFDDRDKTVAWEYVDDSPAPSWRCRIEVFWPDGPQGRTP